MSELPKGWEAATGSDLFTLVRGVSYEKSTVRNEPAQGLIPVLRANNIQSGKLNPDDLVYVPERFVSPIQMLRNGDFLIAASSGSRSVVGKAAPVSSAEFGASFGAFCTVARPTVPDTHGWLKHFFNSEAYRKFVESVALGININNLRGADLARVPIPLPPLAEQRRIVAKLDQVMARTARARAELARIPALIAQHKRAILTAAFSKSSSTVCVRDLVSKVIAGKNLKCEERPPTDLELGVVKVSAVTWGRFDPAAAKTLPPTFDPPPHTKISRGDFLISRANTLELVGAVVIVEEVPGNLYLSDKILRLEMAADVKRWLLWFLRSPYGRAAIEAGATGNQLSMRNLSQEALGAIRLPFPDAAERNAVVRRIESTFARLDKVAQDHAQATRLLDHLDQALLANAFRGELVPQDPSDEPAAALLARIRAARTSSAPTVRKRRAEA